MLVVGEMQLKPIDIVDKCINRYEKANTKTMEILPFNNFKFKKTKPYNYL